MCMSGGTYMYFKVCTFQILQYHTCGNQNVHDITEFCSINMDA